LGKLKDFQLHINRDVRSISQEIVQNTFQNATASPRVQDSDVIEKVKGATKWTALLVIIPKVNGDMSTCVDMSQAYSAVARERFSMPNIELNEGKFFTKLDLNIGYDQIELGPQSRYINISLFPVLQKYTNV
jgi:hypothetical protein